ncbi:PREDICTED: uncharacterized protein LOC109588185 isoform X1 [Amphimedon queenslandica]|uniref:Fibronectin type-III domain-containing protein n=1 Tax=Amphimedon queenslandica TaxID=400682 RepID=A0AAN0JST2_AMPQE|nr:PREDICTED: uncharacterized protein LOC109588185 isoform X1 [Amphimedon queenslandica]|eukprot:XP_019859921.1 PREDICTED: uncharacterized protein LOC109588185 isoform X1 [Amphimedon queenslandica]
MLLNTVALLLGVELILLYSGLADGVITNFQCTDGPVCAGDSIECRCTTDTGTLEWFISYSLVEPLKWNLIPVVSFFRNKTESEGYYGYNFTFNTTYTGLNTSILTFNLNHSESVLIECANGEVIHKMNTTVTDLGYYAKAPTNLTTTFNPSRITLEWEDTGNNCTSTVHQVTLNATMTSELTYHNTNKTTIFINSSELNITEVYTYTVRGWNEQQSNNSEPFTLAPQNVMNVTINTTNTSIPCKNDRSSCCVNVTLSIIPVSPDTVKHPSQYYNITYTSNTGNIPVTYEVTDYNETEWTESELKYNETYHFTIIPINNFSTGMPIKSDITTSQYQCQLSGNGGDGGDHNRRVALSHGILAVIIIAIFCTIPGIIYVVVGIILVILNCIYRRW